MATVCVITYRVGLLLFVHVCFPAQAVCEFPPGEEFTVPVHCQQPSPALHQFFFQKVHVLCVFSLFGVGIFSVCRGDTFSRVTIF